MEYPPGAVPITTEIQWRDWAPLDGYVQINTGLRGAATVEDDVDDGGVAGFFHPGNGGGWALSPWLDELINRSWSVV